MEGDGRRGGEGVPLYDAGATAARLGPPANFGRVSISATSRLIWVQQGPNIWVNFGEKNYTAGLPMAFSTKSG